MPRPFRQRNIRCSPESNYFKPRGIPIGLLEVVVLTMDEFEALRLGDLEEMYQEEAAKQMNISRQTFGNIVAAAHKKIADCLVHGKALKIEGGVVKMIERPFFCYDCKHEWTLRYGVGRPKQCPKCESSNIQRAHQSVHQENRWARGSRGAGAGRCRRKGEIS